MDFVSLRTSCSSSLPPALRLSLGLSYSYHLLRRASLRGVNSQRGGRATQFTLHVDSTHQCDLECVHLRLSSMEGLWQL